MRILSISNCPAREHLGSGYVISGFVNGLRSLGNDVDLLEPDDYEILQRLRPRATSYRQALGMLGAAVRAKGYDIVEFWGGESWLATQWLALRDGLPLVVQHTNGPEPRYGEILKSNGLLRFSPLQSWHAFGLMPGAFSAADGIVTVSEYDRTWLETRGFPRSGRRIAIEVPLADCFLQRVPVSRGSRYLAFCGTWLAKKGIDLVVPDIARVLREFPEWRFLVLGTSPGARVQESFPEDVRSRVEVAPFIMDKEALARQYERAEIFVFPSVIESFGIALAEAMACGCAPVATPVGFAASLEDGRNALVLHDRGSPHLYAAVKRLILDPELRRQVAVNARERVQGLRWKEAITKLSQTYNGWLAEHRQAQGVAA